jgi:hypothetical protein
VCLYCSHHKKVLLTKAIMHKAEWIRATALIVMESLCCRSFNHAVAVPILSSLVPRLRVFIKNYQSPPKGLVIEVLRTRRDNGFRQLPDCNGVFRGSLFILGRCFDSFFSCALYSHAAMFTRSTVLCRCKRKRV